jgi:hypothetical protein
MKYEDLLETHINIVNVIVASTNDIIPIIISNPRLDDSLKETMAQVFRFVERIISLLPDILITNKNTANHKNELISRIDKICQIIDQLPEEPIGLQDAWFEFNYWWKDLNDKMKEISASNNTIFLSMN